MKLSGKPEIRSNRGKTDDRKDIMKVRGERREGEGES